MLVDEKAVPSEMLQDQLERILRSNEFRNSEVLRRLLIYLGEKSISGCADQLKEYVVAIEGLGKPPTYDPQHNSAVRIQVGRLRQKLTEYYRTEGQHDPLLIELPKGGFRLRCEPRQPEPEQDAGIGADGFLPAPSPSEDGPHKGTMLLYRLPFGFIAGLIAGAAILLVTFLLVRPARVDSPNNAAPQGWSQDLATLWAPFLGSSHPLLLSIEDPLFAELRSNPGTYMRNRALNQWPELASSPAVIAAGKALDNNDLQPSHYYTAFGEAEASFLLGRLLGPHIQFFSLAKASQLSWQQLSDNNVIFVGVQNLFFDQVQGMPITPDLVPDLGGIRNPRPRPGEPSMYADQYLTAPAEQGVIYALVTHLPGPLGSSEVESFTSNRSAGYVGAVQWFTNPEFARILVDKLKAQNNGVMPRYYQVLLKVHFKDDVPTETTYVLSRVLH